MRRKRFVMAASVLGLLAAVLGPAARESLGQSAPLPPGHPPVGGPGAMPPIPAGQALVWTAWRSFVLDTLRSP